MSNEVPVRSRESSRNETFAEKMRTRICQEVPSAGNPYLAEHVSWHGYDVADLMVRRDLVDVFFLLLKGELPNAGEKRLLEQILIALANPGPRHPATRSVISASAFRTHAHQFLPIGLSLMSGENMGSAEVDGAMRFLARNLSSDPEVVADSMLSEQVEKSPDDGRSVPGFGQRFAGIDPFAAEIARLLHTEHPDSDTLRWGQCFVARLAEGGAGWLLPGVAAAVFVELGFRPAVGACLYQMAACPGLLAHGIEMSNKPLTALPFVADENYHLVGESDVKCS